MRAPWRPRFLYLWVRGPWALPLLLFLPLSALEWGLALLLFLKKGQALFRGRPFPVPWRAFLALRLLPPTVLVAVEAEKVEVKVVLW
ncbi:MAG: hypothetical protein NZ846_05490 [Thermus sp.]|uniref:hypothetical protein n=1 Tax=Thermus sp. TaxID=275 RepID=UPI0025E1D728|nr:hypothetical protein [Thermus sp.]MCS6868860.1 hypothetical protein [Thermus sp.]MCS7218414.1 hypothetical protein [Thermus sp.]MCX7849264.1 hypothetical protein [Thermus sp.]MDW8016831.1 hypothetical protein [Thermus sp.]MDW8356982.1 hypothetical protein [Thermus sp.]